MDGANGLGRCQVLHGLLCLGGCKTPLFMDTYGRDYYTFNYTIPMNIGDYKLYYPRTLESLEIIIAIIIQEMEIK
jgi:hypothetical protein